MTGVLARTTTHAFNNAAWPYIQQIAAKGLDQAILDDATLRNGLNVRTSRMVHPALLGAVDGSGGGTPGSRPYPDPSPITVGAALVAARYAGGDKPLPYVKTKAEARLKSHLQLEPTPLSTPLQALSSAGLAYARAACWPRSR